MHKLQAANDPGLVECNAELTALFGERRFKMPTLAAKLLAHLKEPEPVEVEYTVKVSIIVYKMA